MNQTAVRRLKNMRKTILISIVIAWIMYFALPFEAPALSYFVASAIAPFLMKYVKEKFELYVAAALMILVVVLQGYIVAGLLIGVLVSIVMETKHFKTISKKMKLSENKKILSLVGVNAIIVISVFANKFLNGGF